MNKTQLLNQYTKDSQQRSFFASALDKRDQANQRHSLMATGFFTPEEQEDFAQMLEKLGGGVYEANGGFSGAERKVFLFPPDWMEEIEDIPLTVIQAQIKGAVQHSDVLGSLMGLGLTRRKIGDILMEERRCSVIVLTEVAPILLSQWSAVGRYGISLQEIPLTELCVPEQGRKEINSTVASLRLDSMIATAFSLSRSKAVALIASGRVVVNHRESQKPDKLVQEGDMLGCRGYGKCQVTAVKGQSRKGRFIVCLEKFI